MEIPFWMVAGRADRFVSYQTESGKRLMFLGLPIKLLVPVFPTLSFQDHWGYRCPSGRKCGYAPQLKSHGIPRKKRLGRERAAGVAIGRELEKAEAKHEPGPPGVGQGALWGGR